MNLLIETLSREARKLSPLERTELVEVLLQSLGAISAEHQEKWAAEAKDRLAAYQRGDLKSRDLDEALAKYSGP